MSSIGNRFELTALPEWQRAKLEAKAPEANKGHGVVVNDAKGPVLKGAELPQAKNLAAREGVAKANVLELKKQVTFAQVPDREGLINVAGRPKDDIKFLGLTIHKMSTGYKAVLGKLDDFHAATDLRSTNAMGGAVTADKVRLALDSLIDLETLVTRYERGAKHSRKEEVGALKSQLAAERRILTSINRDIGGLPDGRLPDGMSLRDAIEGMRGHANLAEAVFDFRHRREGGTDFQPMNVAAKVKDDSSPPRDVKGTEYGVMPSKLNGSGVDILGNKGVEAKGEASSAKSGALTDKEFLNYSTQGITLEQAKMLHARGIGPEEGKKVVDEYKRLGVPMTEKTMVGDFRPANEQGGATKLGNGAFNTVYKVQYKNGFTGVFKAEVNSPKAVGDAGGWMGINVKNPQLGCRNITAMVTNKLLGWNVVPKVEFGIHNDQLGIVMELAPGKVRWASKEAVTLPANIVDTLKLMQKNGKDAEIRQFIESYGKSTGIQLRVDSFGVHGFHMENPIRYDHPSVRRELVKLQWLDGINAQGDRHGGNYLVHLDEKTGQATVTGIDNDQAEGVNAKNADDVKYASTFQKQAFRGCGWPPIADTDMYKAIMSLKEEDIRQQHEGLLTPAEIDSKVARLKNAKIHMESLRTNKMLIKPTEWGGTIANDALKPGTLDNYVGRDARTTIRS
jgi:hypothetical protein